jgi:hypothetical protein
MVERKSLDTVMAGGGRLREVWRYEDRIRIHMYYYINEYYDKMGWRQM